MSKLNNFADSGIAFLSDEIFNFAYWYFYIGLFFSVGLIFALIPPLTPIGIGMLVAPIVLYGLAWAVVGVAKLIDLVDKHINGYTVLKDTKDGDEVIISEPVAVVAQDPAQNVSLDSVLNAAGYSQPYTAVAVDNAGDSVNADVDSSVGSHIVI